MAATKCHGEAGRPPCRTPPILHTRNLLVPAATMDFCGRHFWLWVAASLERRGEPELEGMAPGIRRHVRSGTFDVPPKPPVQAIPFSMVAPDLGFEEE